MFNGQDESEINNIHLLCYTDTKCCVSVYHRPGLSTYKYKGHTRTDILISGGIGTQRVHCHNQLSEVMLKNWQNLNKYKYVYKVGKNINSSKQTLSQEANQQH